MARYLVTGAAGFIASKITELLLHQGHQVLGIDNMNHAYDVRMKEFRLKQLQKLPGFSFLKMDIADCPAVQSLVGERVIDAVFNLAARAGVRDAVVNPWVFVETNLTGTLNLLDLCRQMGIEKFIMASTSGVYGANPPLPTPESAETDHPLQPYAASKKGAELMCYAYHHLHGIDVTIFRYFNVFGPAGRPDAVMFRLVKWIVESMPVKIYGDGQQSRGFTYIDDVVRGTVSGLKPMGYEIINLGGHESVSINHSLRLLEQLAGKKAQVDYQPPNPADIFASQADISKAGRLLGWEPQVSLEAGLKHTLDWYLQERSWANLVET